MQSVRLIRRVLAIDPGVTAGIAVKILGEYNCVQSKTLDGVLVFLQPSLQWDYVIVELFATAGKISKYGLYTIEMVGAVAAMCKTNNYRLIRHPPQKRYAFLKQAHAIITEKHLRMEGEHKMDALAHLLSFEYWLANGDYN